jgi:HAD superfamily hydrolase (TIGR01549 family)
VTKAVIFDIDGTLLDSVDLHAESWVRTFSEFGIKAEFDRVRAHIGEGADRLLPVFLPKGAAKELQKKIERRRAQLFKQEYLPKVAAFPMVRELCTQIKQYRSKVALASSCTADEIARYKKIADIADLVDCEATSDDTDDSKPAPDIFLKALQRLKPMACDQCVVVGDTRFDGEAARKAGMKFIGLLCGGSSENELRAAGAIAIYSDPADLLQRYNISPIALSGMENAAGAPPR